MTQPAQLVRVPLTPARSLAAAWYAPARETRMALLHIHGKGGNFYTGTGASIPEHDTARELAHLSINMRCHDLGYTRDGVPMPDPHRGHIAVDGGMWERLADGHTDVEAGMRWLRARGYDRIVLVGRSSGGFFAAQACARRGVEAAGRVLLSPVISNKRHLDRWFPDGQLEPAIRRAQALVDAGEGHQLLPTRTWFYAISAASLLERLAEPDDVLPRMLDADDAPLLLGCGDQEPRLPEWRALFDALRVPHKRWLALEGVGHDYGGRERELTEAVLEFTRAAGRAGRAARTRS